MIKIIKPSATFCNHSIRNGSQLKSRYEKDFARTENAMNVILNMVNKTSKPVNCENIFEVWNLLEEKKKVRRSAKFVLKPGGNGS